MFNILNLDTQAFVTITDIEGEHGLPAVYSTGQEAASVAKQLTEATGIKHQPRKIAEDKEWRARESARFASATYTRVPWNSYAFAYLSPRFDVIHVETIVDHFPHVSTDQPGMMAYTPDAAYGAADRQVRIKPRRYLQQYFGDIAPASDLDFWAAEFARLHEPVTVHFADTEDDIETLYVNGPSSCMSHSARKYDSNEHPTRVYAAGDLAVAYVGDLADASQRALCWPAKKIYSRVYGSGGALECGLAELGYDAGASADFEGARLLKKPQGHGFITPYVDCVFNAREERRYLILDRHGDINCSNTNGLSEPKYTCGRCGDDMGEDEGNCVNDGTWCDHCYSRYTFTCERCEETYADSTDNREMQNGVEWCGHCFERHGVTCEATHSNYDIDDTVTLADGRVWGNDYFEDHGYQCRSCGEAFENGENCGNGECCEEHSDADQYVARQGRDEHPAQLEIPLHHASYADLEIRRTTAPNVVAVRRADGWHWRYTDKLYTSFAVFDSPEAAVAELLVDCELAAPFEPALAA